MEDRLMDAPGNKDFLTCQNEPPFSTTNCCHKTENQRFKSESDREEKRGRFYLKMVRRYENTDTDKDRFTRSDT